MPLLPPRIKMRFLEDKNMAEIELKPCPFCSGEAVLINTTAFGKSCKSVVCIKCKATVNNFGGDRQEERATEAWNRRAENVTM